MHQVPSATFGGYKVAAVVVRGTRSQSRPTTLEGAIEKYYREGLTMLRRPKAFLWLVASVATAALSLGVKYLVGESERFVEDESNTVVRDRLAEVDAIAQIVADSRAINTSAARTHEWPPTRANSNSAPET